MKEKKRSVKTSKYDMIKPFQTWPLDHQFSAKKYDDKQKVTLGRDRNSNVERCKNSVLLNVYIKTKLMHTYKTYVQNLVNCLNQLNQTQDQFKPAETSKHKLV